MGHGEQQHHDHDIALAAATETRIRRPPPAVSATPPLRTASRHASPAVNGLAAAIGRPQPLQRSDPRATPDGAPCHRNLLCRGRTRLWRPPRSPDRRYDANIVLTCISPFDCFLAGRLKRLTGEMPANQAAWPFVVMVINHPKLLSVWLH